MKALNIRSTTICQALFRISMVVNGEQPKKNEEGHDGEKKYSTKKVRKNDSVRRRTRTQYMPFKSLSTLPLTHIDTCGEVKIYAIQHNYSKI